MARTTNAKAKEKKQKIILAGLGVVLLGVMAFELPPLLKGGSSSTPASVTTATTATSATTPPGAGALPPAATVRSDGVVFATSVSRLATLSRFKLKDPFDSHGVGATSDPAASSPPAAASQPATPPAAAAAAAAAAIGQGARSSAAQQGGPIFGTVQGPAVGSPKSSNIPAAMLLFNGKKIRVALGEAFPKKHPYFRLAGVKPGSLLIAVVNGSLADGSSSLDLRRHTPLTLVDTTDGARFTIEFLSGSKAT